MKIQQQILLISFLTTLGCVQKKNNYFELSIKATKCKECLVELISYHPFDFHPIKIDSFYLDTNGESVTKTQIPNNIISILSISDKGKFPIILENGYDLEVSIEEYPSEPKFKGSLSALNLALNASLNLQKKYESSGDDYILTLKPNAFFSRLNSLGDEFDSIAQTSLLEVDHKLLLEKMQQVKILKYQYNYALANYDFYSSKTELPPYISDIPEYPDHPDILGINFLDYGVLGQMYLDKNIYPLFWPKTDDADSLIAFPFRVDSLIRNKEFHPKIKEFLIAKNLYNHIKPNQNRKILNKLLVQFIKEFESSEYQLILEERYSGIFNLDKGSTAPNIIGVTSSNDTIQLNDFKGKIVLIDIWASWCRPCLEAMPTINRIEQKFDSNDVVFLYVSIDEYKENWEKYSRKYLEKKLNIIEIEKTSVFYDYMISGIPHYILVDQNGKIIDPDISPSKIEALEFYIKRSIDNKDM